MRIKIIIFLSAFVLCVNLLPVCAAKQKTLLNVSYEPTGEFYQQYNQAFIKHWQEITGERIAVYQSHGGSGKQARAVIDGLDADIVTLALAYDIDAIAKKSGFIDEQWQKKFPDNSTPYTSTIVLLVRKGNPKNIHDWDDLVKSGISVITPNPKVSGGARWNYLAAWGYALEKWDNDQNKAQEFLKAIFQNVAVLDSGARASAMTFVQRGMGDVLIAWENEAYLIVDKWGKDQFEIVFPSVSILAEPPVAVVERNAIGHGTLKMAQEYIQYLYSEQGQSIAAEHYYRPRLQTVAQKHAHQFQPIKLFTVDGVFGGWQNAQKIHFADHGTFDQIYEKIF